MVGVLRSSTDILESGFGSTGDIGATASKLKEAQAVVINLSKFTSRSELEKSGLAKNLMNCKGY